MPVDDTLYRLYPMKMDDKPKKQKHQFCVSAGVKDFEPPAICTQGWPCWQAVITRAAL